MELYHLILSYLKAFFKNLFFHFGLNQYTVSNAFGLKNNMTKEQKFYKALQDVFIGAQIEGEGGFVNLMRND